MGTRERKIKEGAWLGQDKLECNAAPTAQQSSHTLEEAKSLFADAIAVSAGHDAHRSLPSSYLDHHMRESLKRKGVLGESENASALPVQLHHPSNPTMEGIQEDAARILARQDSRKRKTQPTCSLLDDSSFETQNFLVEGAGLGELGQAEEKSLEAGCSTVEAASLPAVATDGEVDIPLTPEIVHNHRGRSADHTSSSPEPSSEVHDVNPSPEIQETQQGELSRNEETCSKQPLPKTKDGADVSQEPQKDQVTPVEEAPDAKEKTTKRKRKYLPKIRTEKPRASRGKKPKNGAGKETTTSNAASPVAEIPEVMSRPSLLQVKSFARTNQRYPKPRKRSRKPANPPGGEQPVVQDPAHSDDFSRFSLFADHSIKLSETTQSPPCRSSPLVAEEMAENLPSTPQGSPPVDPFLATCRDFTLVMPPTSPPTPGAVISDAADLWDSFELESHASTSVRRALSFDEEPVAPWLKECHMSQLNQVSVDMPMENPSEKELQMVAYDDGAKKMVVYKKTSRGRRIKYKPKVNLDSSTVKMFKTLTIKGTAEDEAAAAQETESWEHARRQWQHRAHHFISVMREVQGSRAFSRWKGSVVDSVGGAFLTQNVSDFLSSNAFISLRARFPARKTQAKETTTTSKEQAAPVENSGAEGSLDDAVEILRTGFRECHIEPKDTSFKGPATLVTETTGCAIESHLGAMGVELTEVALEELHHDLEEVQGMLEPGVGESGSAASWREELASAVILEKFASVVAESVIGLTEVGREKVLAATLRRVLGKKHTTREMGLGKALKNFKLRPARAALRRSSDNYRYRHNVSFRLLSGEARANWEAGFVMKCQKAKWEPLRAAIVANERYCRDPLTEDCVDWSAVQQASVHELADVIKNRGQHNALAGRMKAFLDRVHRDHNGSIDLEWIRKLPPQDAKAFLLSFRGVGLKSVECIRLLTLHHPSFPVDTNVGRILVRLGWVPLEPLPEETQLHLLELYPIQSQIQQYIWPRMCTLDQKTLYELHYQMITFGKVFCTKSKPNCNACPLRSECKHYASSYASAKLQLKWSENQEKQSRMLALQGSSTSTNPSPQTKPTQGPCIPIIEEPCIPIIEEPQSPEPNPDSIPDIEELPFNIGNSSSRFSEIIGELCAVVDVKKTLLDLNCEPEPDTFVLPLTDTEVLKPQVLETNTHKVPTVGNGTEVALERTQVEGGLEEPLSQGVADEFINHLPSHELILLPPQAPLAPAPKLKNVQRLRTVHYVYELPDNHPLLFEMDKREADDPCFYLLAIWSPDEVPATMPKINDDDASNPFASCQDNDPEKTVRGTILIPCKTAMRGYFPLNGTYFQVNEVFADHASSVQPIDVPRTLLWSLRRRFVYFSTAVSNLFREGFHLRWSEIKSGASTLSVDFKSVSGLNVTDMSQEEIKCCFQKGYVCLRAFDVATRQPKILAPRLHESGAKIVKAPAPRKGRGRKTPTKGMPQTKPTKKSTSEAPLMDTNEACHDS